MRTPPVTPTPGADVLEAVLSATLRRLRGPAARLERWTTDQRFTEHGKRRVVRYDLQVQVTGAAEHHQWLGKVYDRDEDGRRVAGVLRDVAAGDCGARGALAVPRVLAYHPSHRLLLMTYEPGESVSLAIAHDTAAVLAAMGRALSALHSSPVAVDGVLSPVAVLADLRPRLSELAARLPTEAAALRRALAALEETVPAAPATPRFVHGDFGPANLLWRADAGELVVLDFDKCARGDPAADLGNLLAQLRRMTVRKPDKLRDFVAARGAVLEAYRRWSPPDPQLDDRVAWYERATLLRKIHRVALAAPNTPESEATRLLRVCESHAA
jgi:streptomycin 6-kinase